VDRREVGVIGRDGGYAEYMVTPRRKGLQAVHARVEDLAAHGFNADIFISFEMLEHLPTPIQFLKNSTRFPDVRPVCRGIDINENKVKH